MNKIKGILTDCHTNKEREVELEYEIVQSEYPERNGDRIFKLINGVTGYESFYIDDTGTVLIITLAELSTNGWLACAGTKGRYDKLFIPASEMNKALKGL